MMIRAQFQFHEGPIKTSHTESDRHNIHSFNSMKVRLKRPKLATILPEKDCFNSMKVRLKRFPQLRHPCCRNCFNSMKVRLKPYSVTIAALFECFNSMKVRLKLDGTLMAPDEEMNGFNSMKVRLKHYTHLLRTCAC